MTAPIAIWGGFECGRISWPRGPRAGTTQDFLRETEHWETADVRHHYEVLREHGIMHARDGLLWTADTKPSRAWPAMAAGIRVAWDVMHYDAEHRGMSPFSQAFPDWFAASGPIGSKGMFCPINEPRITAQHCGGTGDWYAGGGGREFEMLLNLVRAWIAFTRNLRPGSTILYTDPIYGRPFEYDALDMILGRTWPQLGGHEGAVDIIGINWFPHDEGDRSISSVLLETWRRYGKPVMISETSWHDGHPGHACGRRARWTKGDWFRHVVEQAEIAQAAGADVRGVCWYPIIDSPAWNGHPDEFWSHGLFRHGGGLDESLSRAIMDYTGGRVEVREAAE